MSQQTKWPGNVSTWHTTFQQVHANVSRSNQPYHQMTTVTVCIPFQPKRVALEDGFYPAELLSDMLFKLRNTPSLNQISGMIANTS